MLGHEHPLSRALRRADVVRRDLKAVLVACAGAAAFAAAGTAWAIAVELVRRRRAHRALRAQPPLRARPSTRSARPDHARRRAPATRPIARERRRLLEVRTRRRLASRFDFYVRSAARPSRSPWRAYQPFADLFATRAVSPELLRAAELIRQVNSSACGIARAEHLLSQGFLITHGSDAARLRQELVRVIDPLQAASSAAKALAAERADSPRPSGKGATHREGAKSSVPMRS